MSTVILAEKKKQGQKYMTALGIEHKSNATKATGSTFLDPMTTVVCASGHLISLREPEYYDEAYKDRDNMDILPLIPPKFAYEVDSKTKFLFYQAKDELKKADQVIIGTDNDFEGGAIAFNICWLSGVLRTKKIMRSFPTALEKQAIIRQFNHLMPIDKTWKQANAAIARARSDWLIGMNLSRLYTHKLYEIGIPGNFAVGRVIAATLNLICRWYDQINSFHEEPVYEMKGTIAAGDNNIDISSPVRIVGDGKNDPKQEYLKLLKAHNLMTKQIIGKVKSVTANEKESYPPVLMTKGDLYKEMKKTYGWSQPKSEKIMQLNYEEGFQTYPRTDAGEITEYEYEYLGRLFNDYIDNLGLGGKFKPVPIPEDRRRKYITKEKDAGAHLGIIPTELLMPQEGEPVPEDEGDGEKNDDKTTKSDSKGKKKKQLLITADQRKMYEVVVRRSLSVWQEPYMYISNQLTVDINGVDFKASNTGKLSDGWKAIMPKPHKKCKTKSKEKLAFDYRKYLKEGQEVQVNMYTDFKKTVPPKPLTSTQIFDKGGLMEKAYKYVENKEYAKILRSVKGLGTSATRDTAMASLVAKKYVTVNKNDVITVTGNGWLINWLLRDSLLSSPVLTAKWEEEYQLIAEGKDDPSKLINATAKLVIDQFQKVKKTWNPDEIKAYFEKHQGEFLKETSFGKCPQCQVGDILFTVDKKNKGKFNAYRCTNKKCNFVVYQHYFNKKFTDNDIKKMISDGESRLIKGIKSLKGKTYDCKFKLKYNKEKEMLIPTPQFGNFYSESNSKSKNNYLHSKNKNW